MRISVVKKDQKQSFDIEDGERILYAGLRQGLGLPHECATGTCGSCKAVLNSGEIHPLWDDAPGAKSCKPAKNEFLMCQSAALGDCEVSFRGKFNPIERSHYRPDYFDGKIFGKIFLTRDVIQFWVRFDRALSFKPGQFVVMNIPGLTGGRAYSMVNHSQDSHELEFIVKRFSGGGFSEWMFTDSKNDATVRVFGPLGIATLDSDERRDLICITGGSGIAGIVSLLSRAVDDGYFEHNKAHLFFGVRTEQDLFFQERLLELSQKSDQKLKITFAFSESAAPEGKFEKAPGIDYLHGYVTPLAMQQIGEKYDDQIVFLAGPPMMVDDAIRQLVLEVGCAVDAIRYDKFG
ncbi:MAG: toluene monooxygenase electron transfer component [Gammaproteobacteria bacterium]|jgi:toluene monooxygenase electron transfer component